MVPVTAIRRSDFWGSPKYRLHVLDLDNGDPHPPRPRGAAARGDDGAGSGAFRFPDVGEAALLGAVRTEEDVSPL